MPTYEIQGPDGKTYEIDGPAGASREQIIAKVKERLGSAPPKISSKDKALAAARNRSKNTNYATRAFTQGATFNLSDEIDALGAAGETGLRNLASKTGLVKGAGYSPAEAYQAVMQSEAEAMRAGQKEMPVTSFVGNTAGAVLSPVSKIGTNYVGGASGLGQTVGRSAVVGGAMGAGYGAGAGNDAESRLRGAVEGGLTGAVVGGAVPLVGRAVEGIAGKVTAPPRLKKAAPSLDALQAAKTQAYKAADQAGVAYAPNSVSALVDDITAAAASKKINPMITPKAAAMIDELQALKGTQPSLTDLDQWRQVVGLSVEGSPAEDMFGSIIRNKIDDFVNTAGPQDVVAGSADDAANLINAARSANTRFQKFRGVEEAVNKADLRAASTGSGGNLDNATRQNLRSWYEKNGRFLTDQEKVATEKIIRGEPLQNFLRLAGKLSPTGNGLMAALNLGSAATLGPMGAVPAGVGIASKYAADKITTNNVENLLRIIAQDAPQQAAARSTTAKALADSIRTGARYSISPAVSTMPRMQLPAYAAPLAAQEEQPQ